jgi:hypothetical protein
VVKVQDARARSPILGTPALPGDASKDEGRAPAVQSRKLIKKTKHEVQAQDESAALFSASSAGFPAQTILAQPTCA